MTQQDSTQRVLACAQCGKSFGQSELVPIAGSWVCGACKPAFLSRVVAGGPAVASSLRYAGVGVRFGARFIDGLLFLVPFGIFMFMAMPDLLRNAGNKPPSMFNGKFVLVGLVFGLFYEVLMLHYKGATLGKMACGIKVIRSDGSSLSWGTSFYRYFIYNVVISAVPILNSVLLITTAIMAGTDSEKRALEDRVCDTRVIYTRS
jgi:uncharacterized RDD family membrane protein YckC